MQKIFILALLCSALCLSRSFEANSRPDRQLDQYAATSGQIPLTLGYGGFFVHADFSNYQNMTAEPSQDASDYGNMAIALYTDQTFFGPTCQGFQDYCAKNPAICQATGQNVLSVFPYFQANTVAIQPQVFLDYNHWSLQSPAFYSNSSNCQDNSYTIGGYGLIGMGASSFALPNFDGKNPNFAVYISKNLSNGTIAFNVDLDQAKSSSPSTTLTTNNVWHVQTVNAIDMKKATFDVNASLIFDLNSDSISFPKPIYDQVIQYLEANAAMGKCSIGNDFRPTCQFTGDIRNLPSIKLLIGDETLVIPPEVYVVQTQNTYFYYDPILLKIKSLSTNASQGVQVTSEYENYIILGYPVMSYYYTVFEAGQNGEGTIKLYESDDYVSASSLTWIFAIAGVVGILLIGSIYYVWEKKYRKNRELDQPLMGADPVKIRGLVKISSFKCIYNYYRLKASAFKTFKLNQTYQRYLINKKILTKLSCLPLKKIALI